MKRPYSRYVERRRREIANERDELTSKIAAMIPEVEAIAKNSPNARACHAGRKVAHGARGGGVMKKALLILACAAISGCRYQTAEDGTTDYDVRFLSLRVRNVRGHDYVVASVGRNSVSVVHAASCPCHKPRYYTIEELATTNRFPDIRDYIGELAR